MSNMELCNVLMLIFLYLSLIFNEQYLICWLQMGSARWEVVLKLAWTLMQCLQTAFLCYVLLQFWKLFYKIFTVFICYGLKIDGCLEKFRIGLASFYFSVLVSTVYFITRVPRRFPLAVFQLDIFSTGNKLRQKHSGVALVFNISVEFSLWGLDFCYKLLTFCAC